MKKNLMSLLAVLLVGTIGFGISGCGGTDDSTTTVIEIMNFDGGVGHAWLHEAAARFEEEYKNESYANGKTGVKVKITDDMNVNLGAMASQAYNIYFCERVTNFSTLVNQGDIYDVTEWVKETNSDGKTIESKFVDEFKMRLQGGDGNYYAIPHYEWYPGCSYDITMFDEMGFYLAAPDETDIVPYTSQFGNLNFIGSETAKKSCGNDGEYGTADDGLPTTFQDFLILCDYIKTSGVTPFLVSGKYIRYTNYFALGLWASIAGATKMRTNYELSGSIDQVTGYGEEMFSGDSYMISKPITNKLEITDENWERIYDDVNRYYVTAFFEIAYREKWIDIISSEATHVDAMRVFCKNSSNNTKKYGMIMEGSYWYTEAEKNGLTKGAENEVAFMPLPTGVYQTEAVTEQNGRDITLMEGASGLCLVSNVIKGNKELEAAVKDFIKYLYTDTELQAFTDSTGLTRALNYEFSAESLPAYQKSVLKMRGNGETVVYAGTTNEFAKDKIYDLALSDFSTVFTVKYGTEIKNNYYQALRELSGKYDVNAQTLFENSKKK